MLPIAIHGRMHHRSNAMNLVGTWRTLLLVYDRIDAAYDEPRGARRRFKYAMSPQELDDGLASFREFPGLVERLTSGAAAITWDCVRAVDPLLSLSQVRKHAYWPSPDDTRAELTRFAVARRYDSILVYWPQHNFRDAISVPSSGWGWGMAASSWSSGATYATVANAPAKTWLIPMAGEVWLHEWLHGVCAHFAARGYAMPQKDADGGGHHGYVQSPLWGWTEYYRDLMTCNVAEDGRLLGIPLEAWRESPRP